VFQKSIEFFNSTFPGGIQKCPYTVSLKSFYTEESSVHFTSLENLYQKWNIWRDERWQSIRIFHPRNNSTLITLIIQAYDDEDPNIATAEIFMTVKDRDRDIEF
jgi:hypothetical protein